MTIAPATRLGSYEVTARLGAGGMGEVWRATDTRLEREVAIKVLPATFAQDAERLARFTREAKLLASLNHSNIAHVYGFESATQGDESPVHFLAMELVDGEDLSERLKRGAIPVDEAVAIAIQIAEALEAAHEKGIVHRDLKPANVKVTPSGKVKVLDFGLAKAWDGDGTAGSSPELSHSPTLAHTGTQAGVILGTAAYMSPEQARGKAVDKRADIWAFGVVLFEMLTGDRLFAGETVSDILAAVLKTDPDFKTLPPDVPARLRRLLERCLRKDPRERLHDIADARLELTGPEDATPPPAATVQRRPAGIAMAALAAVAVLGSVALIATSSRRAAPRAPLVLAVVAPSNTISFGPIDISRDGRQLAFTAVDKQGLRRLYVRGLDAIDARALPGTEQAEAPFFSPDGRSLGFFADKKLKRIDLAGGTPRVLADASNHRGGAWGADGVILFSPDGGSALFRVAASGGAVSTVTTLAASETSHRWPRFLADGKRFLFMSRRPQAPRLAVEVSSIDDPRRRLLLDASSWATVAGGRLYYVRETTLFAQAVDPGTLTPQGEPVPVAEDLWRDPQTDGLMSFAVADDGSVAYRRGGVLTNQMTWLDREGRTLGVVGPAGVLGDMDLSPDGRRIVTDLTDVSTNDAGALFELDTTTGKTTRVSFGEGNQSGPLYSPDARRIAFAWDAKGPFDLYEQEIGSSWAPTALVTNAAWKFAESWSKDGRFLSFIQRDSGRRSDIWIVPMTGERKPFPFVQTDAEEWGSTFSPDGRFIAYVSDESGRAEVFLRAFPASPTKWQVSTDGGGAPVFRRDGKELFYLSPGSGIVAVPFDVVDGVPRLGTARLLFDRPDLGLAARSNDGVTPFIPTEDGQRFLADLALRQAESSPIVIRIGEKP